MLILVLGRLPQPIQASLVSLVITVREVEPSDVHAGIDEALEGGDVPTSGPKGANYLRLSGAHITGRLDTGEGNV